MVCGGGGGGHMYVCVVQLSLALPPLCASSGSVCALCPVNSGVRCAAFPVSHCCCCCCHHCCWDWGWGWWGCMCCQPALSVDSVQLGDQDSCCGSDRKKTCTYEAGAQLWQSDLANGASQRVGSSGTGMWVGGFCHAQFELGLEDWQRR